MVLLGVIYKITFKGTSYFYIGSSTKMSHRKAVHLSHMRNGKHPSQFLQRVYDKYGEPTFEIIEKVLEGNVFDVEQKYLDAHTSDKNCMNIQTKANGGLPAKVVNHPKLLNIYTDTVVEDMECTTEELASFLGENLRAMRMLLNGERAILNGWVLADSNWKDSCRCSHFGTLLKKGEEVYMIRTISRAYKEIGINQSIFKVIKGELSKCKGWRLVS